MRVIAVTCIFLSSIDTPLAAAAVITCLTLYYVATSIKWQDDQATSLNMPKLWQWSRQRTPKVGRAEFLSRPKNVSPFGNQWNAPRNSFAWSDSPVKGTLNTSGDKGSTGSQDDFYSTFHRTPNSRRFSKKEWEEFTEESTHDSVNELTSTPEFTEWVIKNANRIKLLTDNDSDGEFSG
nr:transmembrane protein 194 [Tanacetum cinerariifolium]